MFETFHQSPSGDYRPTYYNPFEIKHRRRTTKQQFRLLEQTFLENPKPSATIRRNLAQRLSMTPRAVQVWFQNRRAKVKAMEGRSPSSHPNNNNGYEEGAQELPLASGTTSGGSHQVPASPALPLSPTNTAAGAVGEASREGAMVAAANLKRRHSMPNMHPNELPFKQLRDALFGPGGLPMAPPPPPLYGYPSYHHQQPYPGHHQHHPHHHLLPHPHHLQSQAAAQQQLYHAPPPYAPFEHPMDPLLGYAHGQGDFGYPPLRHGSPSVNGMAIPMDLDQFLQSIIAAPPPTGDDAQGQTAAPVSGAAGPSNPTELMIHDHLSSLLYGHTSLHAAGDVDAA